MLKKHREALLAQQQKALAAYHQAAGAIALIDALIVELGQEPVTLDKLKEMLGADSIEITGAKAA